MLFAARSHSKLSELNPRNYSSALFWYWRMSRHRAVDFLIKAYPKDNSEIAANHLSEKYLSLGMEGGDYLDEAQKFEQKVMSSSPVRLFDWYLSMEKKDPLFKTKLAHSTFWRKKSTRNSGQEKGLEYLSAAANQGEHNAVLYLAKYYYEKCQYLIKGKENKENFFKWAKAASSIRISVHGNQMNSKCRKCLRPLLPFPCLSQGARMQKRQGEAKIPLGKISSSRIYESRRKSSQRI